MLSIQTNMENEDLARKAMRGDEEAARLFCGSYTLICDFIGIKYRFEGEDKDIPAAYFKVIDVYDKDGFLLPEYWSLPRLSIK